MSEIMSGNWNQMPWRPLREGIKQVTLAMGADDVTVTLGQVLAGHEKNPIPTLKSRLPLSLKANAIIMWTAPLII